MVIDLSCVSSAACCLLTTPRSAPPHSKMASSICGGFLPKNTLIGTISIVVNLGRPGLIQSIAILFKICPCLCFEAVLHHLVQSDRHLRPERQQMIRPETVIGRVVSGFRDKRTYLLSHRFPHMLTFSPSWLCRKSPPGGFLVGRTFCTPNSVGRLFLDRSLV